MLLHKVSKIFFTVLLCLTTVTSCSLSQNENKLSDKPLTTVCQDFLRKLSTPPETIEFISCEQDVSSYLRPFVAKYRVSGKDAKEVEYFLISSFKMAPLTYTCCGWEPATGSVDYIDNKTNIHYLIGMGVETLYSNQADWHKIPYFTLTISSESLEP